MTLRVAPFEGPPAEWDAVVRAFPGRTQLRLYGWRRVIKPAGDGEAHTPSPDDWAYGWGPRLWRRLPIAVVNGLGPRLVRAIP